MKSAAETEVFEHWMRQALDAAREAQTRGEVPVGTCIVLGGRLLGVSGTAREQIATRQHMLSW